MSRNNQHQSSAATEELAKVIALKIITWQSWLAIFLNTWINHFSKRQQRWLLAAFCTLFSTGLVLCLLSSYGSTAMAIPDYIGRLNHIGLPSERPKPARSTRTDSLTIKK